MELTAFLILALLVIGSAVTIVFHRNTVVSALALACNLVSIAGLFLLLQAQFIGFIQVIVYAGAIMVLILFVIMLLNLQDERRLRSVGFIQRSVGPLVALGLAAILLAVLRAPRATDAFPAPGAGYGTVGVLGRELFTAYFYPFEAISLLIIVAMIGAVLLAKRRI